MNVPDGSGTEVTVTVPVEPGQTSATTSFADLAPDAYALWPILLTVGLATLLALSLLVAAHLALARSGR